MLSTILLSINNTSAIYLEYSREDDVIGINQKTVCQKSSAEIEKTCASVTSNHKYAEIISGIDGAISIDEIVLIDNDCCYLIVDTMDYIHEVGDNVCMLPSVSPKDINALVKSRNYSAIEFHSQQKTRELLINELRKYTQDA